MEEAKTKEDLIKWDDNYKIGYKRIDDQHKELVNIINDLYHSTEFENPENQKLNEAFRDALKKTVDYISFHFSYEEKIMMAINYNKLLEHSSSHKTFTQTIFDYVQSYESGSLDAINKLLKYLKEWLINHVLVSDKEFVDELVNTLRKISINE